MKGRWFGLDQLALGWLTAVLAGSSLLLVTIGLDGLVNHGDTGFPLDAVQRLIDGLWAWNPRLNFGVPQYLAHSTLPFDALRTLPALAGLSVQAQSQLFFMATLGLLGLAAERFATVGLGLRNALSRSVAATTLLVNPFTVNQLLGGQGVQLFEMAALLATLTMFLEYIRTRQLTNLAWFALWSLFVGMVFLPFLALTISVTVGLTQPRREWRRLAGASSVALLVNAFWILPLVARSLTAPVIGEIFQADSALRVLDATRAFTGFEWVARLGYGHFPTTTAYAAFLSHPVSVVIGLLPSLLALWLLWQTRRLPIGRAFGWLWLGSLMLATGLHYRAFAGSYQWLFDHLPFFQAYRVPTKWLIPEMIGLAAVLGLGFERVESAGDPQRRSRWGWLALIVLSILATTGGLLHGRSIAREIQLAHYPTDYFDRLARPGRWLELLPAATAGGYVPTQDLPTALARVYSPAISRFDRTVEQAVTIGTDEPLLAARGLSGWLVHGDIPPSGTLGTTLGPGQTALEFRPSSTPPAALVSVFDQSVITNQDLPDNSILASQPGTPYLVTASGRAEQFKDDGVIFNLFAEERVVDSPATLSTGDLTGQFRLLTSVISAHQPIELTVGHEHQPLVVDEHGVGVSAPFTLDSQAILTLTAAPPRTLLAPIHAGAIEVEQLVFETAGPRSLNRSTGEMITVDCTNQARAARIRISGVDPTAIYQFRYQAAATGPITPHVAFEWLNETEQPMAIAPVTATVSLVRPRSRSANLYLYCEPNHGAGAVDYRSLEMKPVAGLALSQMYLVSASYPIPSGQDQSVPFHVESPVHLTVSELPRTGTLVLRERDDPWWSATDGSGRRLERVGQAYGLFPAWQLTGDDRVTIRFLGQRYFLWGTALSLITWVGLLSLVWRRTRQGVV